MPKEIDPIDKLCQELRDFDAETYEHSMRVADLMDSFGSYIEIRGEELKDYRNIGLLHDVGKMEVPLEIITKPGQLNELEMDTMKIHPIYSSNIIAKLPETVFNSQRVVLDAVFHHHEDYNGGGYPMGLSRDNIPVAARILRITDSFDAIRNRRCYKEAKSTEETMKIMNDASGKQFDPNVLTQFDRFIRETRKN